MRPMAVRGCCVLRSNSPWPAGSLSRSSEAAMGNWFKGAFDQFGIPPPGNVDPQLGRTPPRGLDAESRHLLEEALPRGLPFGRDQQNRSERAEWASVEEIEGLKYRPGDILLGKFN